MRNPGNRAVRVGAGPQLPRHQGKCRNLHGHSYRLEVSVEGPLNEHGIVMDFADVKAVVGREIIDRYDHTYLNDLMDNPTAEVIAQAVWKSLEAAGLPIVAVRLWETENCS